MTKDEIFKEIENELHNKMRAEIRLKMLKLELRFASAPQVTIDSPKTDRYLDYCKKNDVRDPEDKQLILRKSLSVPEVAHELSESESTVRRRLERGTLRHAPDSKKRKGIRICSISVYELLKFGEPDGSSTQTEKRGLGSHRSK